MNWRIASPRYRSRNKSPTSWNYPYSKWVTLSRTLQTTFLSGNTRQIFGKWTCTISSRYHSTAEWSSRISLDRAFWSLGCTRWATSALQAPESSRTPFTKNQQLLRFSHVSSCGFSSETSAYPCSVTSAGSIWSMCLSWPSLTSPLRSWPDYWLCCVSCTFTGSCWCHRFWSKDSKVDKRMTLRERLSTERRRLRKPNEDVINFLN